MGWVTTTNPACGCLTSEIERDRVHSTEYGRIQQIRLKHPYKGGVQCSCKSGSCHTVTRLQIHFTESLVDEIKKLADADNSSFVKPLGYILSWSIRARHLSYSSV